MADRDFVVKNGIVVNTSFTANSTQIALGSNVVVNTSSIFVGNATVNAVLTSNSLTINSVSVNSITTNTLSLNSLSSNSFSLGANISINSSAYFVGNATVNAYLNSAGLYINGSPIQTGGGYYKGSNGTIGTLTNQGLNIFRINGNTLTTNVTFAAGENAQATGPLTVITGVFLVVNTDARVSII